MDNDSKMTELNKPTSLTFSFYIVQRLVGRSFSPVSYLLFPVISIRFPFSFFTVVIADLLATLLIKRSIICSDRYSLLSKQINQAYPDNNFLKQVFNATAFMEAEQSPQRHTSAQPSPKLEINTLFDPHRPPGFDTPVFPKYLSLVLQVSSPLANQRFSTLFETTLLEAEGYPRFFIPLISLLLNFVLTIKETASK